MAVLSGQRITAQFWQDNTQRTIAGGYSANAATTTTTGGVEIAFVTSGSVTLRNGRAYRATVSALIKTSSTDSARIFVKRTSTTGTVIMDTQFINADVVANNGRRTYQNIATNQTGSDLTGVVLATIQRASGTSAEVLAAASSTSPATLLIEDIGPATDYPSATPIT